MVWNQRGRTRGTLKKTETEQVTIHSRQSEGKRDGEEKGGEKGGTEEKEKVNVMKWPRKSEGRMEENRKHEGNKTEYIR